MSLIINFFLHYHEKLCGWLWYAMKIVLFKRTNNAMSTLFKKRKREKDKKSKLLSKEEIKDQ